MKIKDETTDVYIYIYIAKKEDYEILGITEHELIV